MPLIVHILEEDLAGWELSHRSPRALPILPAREPVKTPAPDLVVNYHYRPRLDPGYLSSIGLPADLAERIQIVAPGPLEQLVDQDVVCFVDVEKGWMSRKVGERPEVKFQLRRPDRVIEGTPRRMRLRIHSIDASTRPPRVMLEEFKR